MDNRWQGLRVGDRIRIVRTPIEFLGSRHMAADETRELYELLIACGAVLVVEEICEYNLPWVGYEQTLEDGSIAFHSLAVNDDSWELVDDR